MAARLPSPTRRAAGTVWPSATPSPKARASSTSPCASVEKPKRCGSWPTSTTSAIPFRNPIRTGFDSKSVNTPRRAKPATMHSAPMSSASIAASATARDGSLPPRSGTSAAAINGPRAESGPSTSIRDGPNTAYANSAAIVVYRPVTGGSPANSRVGHALGDQQGGQADTREQIGTQPPPPVRTRHPDSRQEPLDAHRHRDTMGRSLAGAQASVAYTTRCRSGALSPDRRRAVHDDGPRKNTRSGGPPNHRRAQPRCRHVPRSDRGSRRVAQNCPSRAPESADIVTHRTFNEPRSPRAQNGTSGARSANSASGRFWCC